MIRANPIQASTSTAANTGTRATGAGSRLNKFLDPNTHSTSFNSSSSSNASQSSSIRSHNINRNAGYLSDVQEMVTDEDDYSINSMDTTDWLHFDEDQATAFRQLSKDQSARWVGQTSSVIPLGEVVISFPNLEVEDANNGEKFLGEKLKSLYFSENLLSQTEHPESIVKTLGVAKSSTKNNFFANETSGGKTRLLDLIRRHNYRPSLEVFINVLKGVSSLHDQGITHRDIKLENLFYNSNTGKPKVGDLGFMTKADEAPEELSEKIIAFAKRETNIFRSRAGSNDATNSLHIPSIRTQIEESLSPRDIIGSPTYMSPRICVPESIGIDEEGETYPVYPVYEASDDLYSLGVVGIECLTGKRFLPKDINRIINESKNDGGSIDYQAFTRTLHKRRINEINNGNIKTKDGRKLSPQCLEVLKSMLTGTSKNNGAITLNEVIDAFNQMDSDSAFETKTIGTRLCAALSCMR